MNPRRIVGMGRGDRKKVRWARDRERKVKDREARRAKEAGTDRKKAARASR
jgi:hypothetical protein